MTTLSNITPYQGIVPIRAEQTAIDFSTNIGIFLNYFDTHFTPETNVLVAQINALSQEIGDLSLIAAGAANYKGEHIIGNSYELGWAVSVGNAEFVSKVDGNTETPSEDTDENWFKISMTLDRDKSPSLSSNIDARGKSIVNLSLRQQEGVVLNTKYNNILIADLTEATSIVFIDIGHGFREWMVELTTNGYYFEWQEEVIWDGDGIEPEWTEGTDLLYFYTTDRGETIKGMRTRSGA